MLSSLHAFNVLPRPPVPDGFGRVPLDKLARLFPYLFKPNRAIAWSADRLSRFPLARRNLRWLLHLQTPAAWRDPILAVIATDGELTLWRYRLLSPGDPEQGGGLLPIRLHTPEQTSRVHNGLALTDHRERRDATAGYFAPERVVIGQDADGGVTLRLFTQSVEHQVFLDFGQPEAASVCFMHQRIPLPAGTAARPRQIGGFGNGPDLLWDGEPGGTDGALLCGNRFAPRRHELDAPHPGGRIRAAAALGDWLAVGGDAPHLWIGRQDDPLLRRGDQALPARGQIRCLAMLPGPHRDDPLILAGCDDHYLYVLDTDRHQQQKVDLKGVVEAILPIETTKARGAWCDLVVLVRERGLLCLRLFTDRCWSAARDAGQREAFIDRLHGRYGEDQGLLPMLLESPDSQRQVLGVALLLHRAEAICTDRLIGSLPLARLSAFAVAFAAHTIKRRLGELPGLDAAQARLRSRCFLQLLERFADGPQHTRVAVRELEGWLLTLYDRLPADVALSEQLDALIDKLPDAKRLLRRYARDLHRHHCAGAHAAARETLGKLVALEERFQFNRLFNEIILAPLENPGRVDSVGIVRDLDGRGLQVFARRGERTPRSFQNHAEPLRVRPTDSNRAWPELPGSQSHIQLVMPLGPRRLLVANADTVSLLPLVASADSPERLRPFVALGKLFDGASAVAVHPAAAPTRIAIGTRRSPPEAAVLLFRIDADGDVLRGVPEQLPLPGELRRLDTRVNSLCWDARGRLWGVTGRAGHLLCWSPGQAGPDDWDVAKVLTIGSPQFALKAIDTPVDGGAITLVTGGEDGVVRSFDDAGRLRWARLLPGVIRGIGLRPRVGAADDTSYAPLSVISERGIIALYRADDGRLLSIAELPDVQLTALDSASVAPGTVQHHLVGTLRGEVRLLEEVPEHICRDPLRYVERGSAPDDPEWEAIHRTLRAQIDRLRKDPDICRAWVEPDAAAQEPLRACWAARQLVERHGEFAPALELLEHFREADQPDVRQLRAHVLGAIGPHLEAIPDVLQERFIAVFRYAMDGALASLITPQTNVRPTSGPMWQAIARSLRQRVLEGRAFVASSVLQCLDCEHADDDTLRHWLLVVLDEVVDPDPQHHLHPGFVQGLLGVLLRRLGYGGAGVLAAFTNTGRGHLRLTRLLHDAGRRNALLQLLEQHSDILLRRDDQCVWHDIAGVLRTPPKRVPRALSKAVAAATAACPDAPDLTQILQPYLALFPDQHEDERSHWRPDWLTRIRQRTDEIRNLLLQVERLSMPARDGRDSLDLLERNLRRSRSPSPLLANIHCAWQDAWSAEIEQARERVNRIFQQEGDQLDVPAAVQQVFGVMHEIGFRNGRYYAIRYLPGCGGPGFADCLGRLELEYFGGGREPHTLLTLSQRREQALRQCGPASPIPFATRRLDGVLAGLVRSFDQPEKPSPGELAFKVRPTQPGDASDPGIRFWDDIWGNPPPAPALVIPVIRKRDDGGFRALSMFVFDLPEDWDPNETESALEARTSPRIREAIRPALCRVIEEIKQREFPPEQQFMERCDRLEQRLVDCVNPDDMQLLLLEAARDIAGAEDGLLVQQTNADGPFLIIGATPASRELFRGVRLNPEDDAFPSLATALGRHAVVALPDFRCSPRRDRIRALLQERFADAGKRTREAQEWLGVLRSLLSVHVDVGHAGACAITLRHREPYHFDEYHLRAVQSLLRRFRWVFQLKRINDERTHWIYAFVHEVRSDLLLAKQPIELMRRRPERRDRYIDTALRQIRKVYDVSQNMLDCRKTHGAVSPESHFAGPGSILNEIVALYDSPTTVARPRISLAPSDREDTAWTAVLAGERDLFERVLRTLMDNAVKYGRDDVRIEAGLDQATWSLRISNPGRMTPQEERLKFTPFEKPKPSRHDGSHVGLAASLALTRANGGSLTLENDLTGDAPRVVATLSWPRVPGHQ